MTKYTPEQAPINTQPELAEWLMRELRRIGDALDVADNVKLETETVAPVRPQEGEVVYADGTLWNPGAGEGYYGYLNGAWVKLVTVNPVFLDFNAYNGPPISTLVSGSTFGGLILGTTSGHLVIGLRENDVSDSFAVVSGSGNWTTDSTWDLLCFRVFSDGRTQIGSAGTPINEIRFGTYTPTISAQVNLDAITASPARWQKIGDQVWVGGQIVIDPTAAAPTNTSFELSLPVASNFTLSSQLSGVIHHVAQGGVIAAHIANDTANCVFSATSTAAATFQYVYSYQVL